MIKPINSEDSKQRLEDMGYTPFDSAVTRFMMGYNTALEEFKKEKHDLCKHCIKKCGYCGEDNLMKNTDCTKCGLPI
jgi:hypothetical protein